MATKNLKTDKQLIKGILLGFLFSIEIFQDRFNADFKEMLNGIEPPMKGVLQYKISEIFLGDDPKKIGALYVWVNENYDSIFEEVDHDFIKYVMEQIEIRQHLKLNQN